MNCKACGLWAPLLALLLGLLVPWLAKDGIDAALGSSATQALGTQPSLSGVKVRSDWGRITLEGPSPLREQALAAAAGMSLADHAHSITYLAAADVAVPVAAASAASASSSTQAWVDVQAEITHKHVLLNGHVASEAQKTLLVDSAIAAFGAGNIVNRLSVRTAEAPAPVSSAVASLARLLPLFGAKLTQGKAMLHDTRLSLSGSAFTQGAADQIRTALREAGGRGLKAEGQIGVMPPSTDGEALQERLSHLLARSTIRFARASAAIDAPSRAILDTAAESIQQVPDLKLRIDGHTDDRGQAKLNQVLSERRAQAVLDYLVGRGVARERLSARGYGQTRPRASNETESGRAANRRITFTVQGG